MGTGVNYLSAGAPYNKKMGSDWSEKMFDRDGKLRVIIIGGSVAGLCCAHALLRSGVCRVMVLEKAKSLTDTGTGLAIDQLSCEAFEEWGLRDSLFRMSKTLDSEENRAIDQEKKVFVTLSRDEEFRHRAIHWSDLHRILYDSLPSGIAQFGHEAVSFEENKDGSFVRVSISVTQEAGDGQPEVFKELHGDVIVAADGSMSRTTQFFLPNGTRRYSGYCAWSGVVDCANEPKLYEAVKRAYPEIGETMYFELAQGSHAVIYELKGKRLNWLWYVNMPEPDFQGDSSIIQPDGETIAAMHEEADRTWMPALAKVMKLSPRPFINGIYDKDPVKQLAWRRVVLVGEAAHPTTLHASRGTNMSVVDACVLGKAFQRWGPNNVSSALSEYESARLPTISQQLLFCRYIGQLKQGMLFEPRGSFPWPTADYSMLQGLLLKNMNFFQWRNRQK
ncbi:unnamed protein product [Calypogeia fissa]